MSTPSTATASPRIRFPKDPGFHAALKRGVDTYFERTGLPRRGGVAMHAKTAAIAAWFAASYGALLVFGGRSGWLAAGLTASLALATAAVGFSVMHDANHGAYSRSARVNHAWGLALDLIGASSYLWRRKHNVQHHTYANVDGLDADIDAAPFLRLAPSQPRRWYQRFQHVYAWPLYGVLVIKWWFVDDLLDLVRGRIGSVPFPRPRGRDLAELLTGKAVFVGWSIVVPALVFRSAWVAVLWVPGAMLLGFVLAIVFQLAHALPDARFEAAGAIDRCLPTGWAEHQVRATADFAPRSRLLGWYLGGLNYQIEHHLFPDVCHVHYPRLAPIVEAICRAHGVPYRAHPTLHGAVAAHYRLLRSLGHPDGPGKADQAPLSAPCRERPVAHPEHPVPSSGARITIRAPRGQPDVVLPP